MEEAPCWPPGGGEGARLRLRPMFVEVGLDVVWEREIWPLATINGRMKRGIVYSSGLSPFVHCYSAVVLISKNTSEDEEETRRNISLVVRGLLSGVDRQILALLISLPTAGNKQA